MRKIHVRTLLGFSTEQLWNTLTGEFLLEFDNGEIIETNANETLYSSYGWDFVRNYPKTLILPKHHVKEIIGSGRLGNGTHLKLLGNCMWSVYDSYLVEAIQSGIKEEDFRDSLAKLIYEKTNAIYNDLTYRLEAYVTSLDITDFIDILDEPGIKKANDSVESTQNSIDNTYEEIQKALKNSPLLINNPIANATKSKLVNINQVQQCVGPRGFLTDSDSTIFPIAIKRGYVQGFRDFHDSFIETRSASKALSFSKSPLQQAEYFSRRLQLISQVVQNLHQGDCGSTEYLLWHVRDEIKDHKGRVERIGDLERLVGKYYMDTDNILKEIKSGDKFLIGKTLKLRTAIHCGHPDPYGICTTCFGSLSLSVPKGTNIGQMCCTSLAQKSSQSVLSVKHLDGSSKVDGIVLTDYEKKYLKIADDENSYLLAERLKELHPKLIINSEKAANITDIMVVRNIEDLNITRISELDEIGISTTLNGATSVEVIVVSLNKRLASMTYPLLEYIRQHGWEVDALGNYVVDMKEWDWSKDILTLPLRHFNLSDHSEAISSMLESSVGKLWERDKIVSANNALVELFDLVNDKLNVNLAVLEVVLYATMIVSAEDNNWTLPKPWGDTGLGVMRLTMANRSLSAAMAYEGHFQIIIDPNSYINTNRIEHIFDNLLVYHE